MIMDVLLYGVSGIVLNVFTVYCWLDLIREKTYMPLLHKIVVILIMSIVGTMLYFLFPQPFRLIISFIFLFFIGFIVANRNFKSAIPMVLISQIIIILAELSFIILGTLFIGEKIETILSTPVGGLLLNIYISLISFGILKTKIPKKIFNLIIVYIDLMKKKEVLTYLIMILVIIIISTIESYMKLSLPIVLTTNTIMTLVFIFIIFKFAITENKYAKTNSKYQVSITSLREYQEILDKYRISTHENKNQLLAIKNMSKDSKIISYINAIIDDKTKDNDAVMNKAYKIPDDRFRSTIYPKMCKIDELKIKYKFLISNDVKTADLIDMDDYLVRDACMILGVYLDNAIEAVKDLNKKLIYLEIYIMDGYLCFDITNNFEGTLDVEKLFKRKYTTKGKEHGYGLVLVNRIVKENDKIENECEVSGNIITQRLKVKM